MLPIFTWAPLLPYEPYADDDAIVSQFAGAGSEQRGSVLSREMLRWPLQFTVNGTDHSAMRAFFRARRGVVAPFYWKDTLEYARTGVALTPTSDGATLAFALPKSGEYGGDHPISDANVKLYRAAVLNGGALSAGTDARTIITDSAPSAGGAAMTADYWYYRRVRFGEQRWSSALVSRAGTGTYRVRLTLVECVG